MCESESNTRSQEGKLGLFDYIWSKPNLYPLPCLDTMFNLSFYALGSTISLSQAMIVHSASIHGWYFSYDGSE